MQKATATYRAPPGDSKVCEMGGVTFFDGKSAELNSYDHPHLIKKLEANPNFDITIGEDDKKPPTVEKKRGRPSNAMIAEAKAKAEQAEKDAKDAAAKAREAKADSDALAKSGDKPADKPAAQTVFAPAQPATPVPPVA